MVTPVQERWCDWGGKVEEVLGRQSVVPDSLLSPESPGYSDNTLSWIPTAVTPRAESVWIKGLEQFMFPVFHIFLSGNLRVCRLGFKGFTDNKLFSTESENLMFLWNTSVIFMFHTWDSRFKGLLVFLWFFHSTHRLKEIPRDSFYKAVRPK